MFQAGIYSIRCLLSLQPIKLLTVSAVAWLVADVLVILSSVATHTHGQDMAKRIGDNNVWVRLFEVSEPTRHRKGFTVYKITSTVFPRSFPESATKITVWKRYSDFKKLHKELELIFKQLFLKGEFPDFPKAKVFGRFEHEVVEERRKAALALLEFTANLTQLFTSKAFITFFETGYSTQDFIGRIFFSKENGIEEPSTAVLEEKSEIPTPCLEPERVWTPRNSTEDDKISLSASSMSSSLSPENPEMPNLNPKHSTVPGELMESEGAESSNTGNELSTVELNTNESANSHNGDLSCGVSGASTSTIQSSHSQRYPGGSSSSMDLESGNRGNGIVRSATVTDDLSSYFDEEFEDAAFLFPTGSCSSLDTLPGFTSSKTDNESDQDKTGSTRTRGLFTLPRRKPNGFGFFDFLPLFPKKSKKKSEEKEHLEKEPAGGSSLSSVGYICEAAGHFAVAQFHESNTDYADAFTAYKEGIRVLLAGAQDDTDRNRKILAKNNLEKYLSRAESLKEMYLAHVNSSGNRAISPVFSSPNRKEQCLSVLNRFGKSQSQSSGVLVPSDLEELKLYKVVGLGPDKSKILVVMNPKETSPRCYVAKVLWKSPCIVYPEKPNLIPTFVPFMVKLLKWFETPDKIVLLLEHAGGGRLIEFVKNYQSRPFSDGMSDGKTPEDTTPDEAGNQSGTHKSDIIENEPNCDSVSIVAEEALPLQMHGKDGTVDEASLLLEEDETLAVLEDGNVIITEVQLDQSHGDSLGLPTSPDDGLELETEVDLSNPDLIEVSKLLANSKALLQTVSKTLEEGSCSKVVASPKKECQINPQEDVHVDAEVVVAKTHDNPRNTEVAGASAVAECQLNERGYVQCTDATDNLEFEQCINPVRIVPEGCVRVWASEIIIAVESLHQAGVTYGNLHIKDVLLGENGHVLLCYKSLWNQVDDRAAWNSYIAPEIRNTIGIPLWKHHPSADWWSVGAILFLLLTGQSFHAAHPEGVFSEMVVKVPDCTINGLQLSRSSQTLLSELLQYEPTIRLGYYGAAEIKSHPFFEGIDWDKVVDECYNDG